MPNQGAFDFVTDRPRRPQKPERLFLGLFSDEPAKHAVRRTSIDASREFGLSGRPLLIDRFHTSLVHVSDRKRLRSKDEFAAELAASTVGIPPFAIAFSRMCSFPGVLKKGRPLEHPLVLLADDGPVMDLYATLGAGLRRFDYRVPEHFQPHLTLSYNQQFVPTRAIDPITFMVKEFVLVHSRLWLTEYRILRTWTLH